MSPTHDALNPFMPYRNTPHDEVEYVTGKVVVAWAGLDRALRTSVDTFYGVDRQRNVKRIETPLSPPPPPDDMGFDACLSDLLRRCNAALHATASSSTETEAIGKEINRVTFIRQRLTDGRGWPDTLDDGTRVFRFGHAAPNVHSDPPPVWVQLFYSVDDLRTVANDIYAVTGRMLKHVRSLTRT